MKKLKYFDFFIAKNRYDTKITHINQFYNPSQKITDS